MFHVAGKPSRDLVWGNQNTRTNNSAVGEPAAIAPSGACGRTVSSSRIVNAIAKKEEEILSWQF
jgi:hypothetical protein